MDLTAQERVVLQACARGLLQEEIAGTLDIPVSAVQQTLAVTMTKLDARSRLEAVVRGVSTGQIEIAAQSTTRNGTR